MHIISVVRNINVLFNNLCWTQIYIITARERALVLDYSAIFHVIVPLSSVSRSISRSDEFFLTSKTFTIFFTMLLLIQMETDEEKTVKIILNLNK